MNVALTGADATLGTLSTVSVDIIDGKLIGRSNISVDCLAELYLADTGKAFGRFVRASIVKKTVSLTLAGRMDVVCQGALGTLKLIGLSLHATTLLSGMDNFRDVTIESFSLPGTGAAADHEEPMLTQDEIVNPSVFTVFTGTLTMDLSLSTLQEKFGVLHGMINLTPGRNRLEMNGLLKPNKDEAGTISDAVAGFLSTYLNGKSSQVVVEITSTDYTNCVWMREALVGLTIATSFPRVEKASR